MMNLKGSYPEVDNHATEAGKSERAFAFRDWQGATCIQFDGRLLIWQRSDRMVHPTGQAAFSQFVGLHQAENDTVLAQRVKSFIDRWGALEICRCGRGDYPASHFKPEGSLIEQLRACGPRQMQGRPNTFSEPVRVWRQYSREFDGVLKLARHLRDAPVAAVQQSAGNATSRKLWQMAWPDANAETNERDAVADQWRKLMSILQRFLNLASIRPTIQTIQLTTGRPGAVIRLEGYGLFSYLAIQLVSACVQMNHGTAFCSSCGKWYPIDRRPFRGKRNYCPACRDQNAPINEASRAYRLRMKSVRGLYRQGFGAKAIAKKTECQLDQVQRYLECIRVKDRSR